MTNRTLLACLAVALSLVAAEGDDRRLEDAADTLSEIMTVKDRAIPQDLLDRAACVVVVPGLKKGAFVVGAKYGRGFVSCRKPDGVGWSAPGAVRVEGGSIGLQIGGSETDVLLLVMNERGARKLMSSQFTLGGDVAVAAGPVGRESTAQTDATMRAEILSYGRSRGAFAGISLQGATLREDSGANQAMYGRELGNQEIAAGGVEAPTAAGRMLGLLHKYSSRQTR